MNFLKKIFLIVIVFSIAISSLIAFIGCTPTPTEEEKVTPLAGATFTGFVDISGKASSGIISLIVSEDSTSITSVGVTLTDLKCNGFSAGSMTKRTEGNFPITEGKIVASVSGIGEIKGHFTSPDNAIGTINLILVEDILGNNYNL